MEKHIKLPFFPLFFVALMVMLSHETDSAMALTDLSTGKIQRDGDYGSMSLFFIPNQGQFDHQVAYVVQGKDKSIFFTAQGLTFVLTEKVGTPSSREPRMLREITPQKPGPQAPQKRWVVKLDFVGANHHVLPESLEQAETVVSYFKGRPKDWKTGLRTSSKIIYRNLWPGIDLVYYGTVNRLKYDFIVHPGADPAQIRLAYRGADKVQVAKDGRLEVTTPLDVFQDEMPVAWQENDGNKSDVPVAYALDATAGVQVASLSTGKSDAGGIIPPIQQRPEGHVYGFTVGDYDRTKTLVLDPEMLVYCGFIGGSGYGDDSGSSIAVDGTGNAYITGQTVATESDFPVTVGPDLSYNGDTYDAFVVKVNADGTGLVYCGYIGGSSSDMGRGIAIDGEGNAYITGQTASSQTSFPVTIGPDLTHNGVWDAFVAKVNATGTALVYCGYIGGSGYNYGNGIDVDGAGNAYITGHTDSTQDSFPVTVGPDLTYNGGGYDAFVAKVNAAGTGLTYCGFIGGSGEDFGNGIAVDGTGNAYITGKTSSAATTFPETIGPDLSYNGGEDAFVAKVNATGTALVYCGFIGGSGIDSGNGIDVDSAGNAYIVGNTVFSTEATFPVTVGPDLTQNGSFDVFVAKVNATGTALVYCGFIGGSGQDSGWGIAVNDAGNAYITGNTGYIQETFPVTVGPDLTFNGGSYDAFVAKVNAAGTGLTYCGYIGGYGDDRGQGIAVDSSGNAYVTGTTPSTEATFPVTTGPDLTFNGGTSDAFVAKIAPIPDAPVAGFNATPTSGLSPLSVSFTDHSTGEITSWAWDFDSNGSVDSTDQNPTHIYIAYGIYTATLTVNGPGGSDAESKTNYIWVSAPVPDADGDGIPDIWELLYFGNTTKADGSTDWDKDGYTDLQEYLNQLNSEKDPAGGEYDPKTVNAPGGTGYVDSDFWGLMIPVITAGRLCAAIPNGNFESGNTAWGEYSELGYEIITNAFPAGVLPHNGSYAAWLGGADNELSLIVQRLPIPSSCSFLTFYHWIDSSDSCGYDLGLVIINETLVGTYQLCAARNTGGWRVQSIDLSAYAGQTVDLIFAAVTDESFLSSWLIDDVSFQARSQ